ncbi:hypothetical protein [Microbacterium sp. Mcb102]|uniref:hypothetical protein n=1 Tax=Microbacterium sp. Mcb102 TaxID=2926012 RepID=UPI0021CADCE5|nr:hypothetical protein [Microbacterium sp. Mcb102]
MLSGIVLTSCAGGAQRSDPTAVVSEYLTAISEGDATTATALDDRAVVAQHEGTTTEEAGDFESLRTDAILQAADSRITDISVEPEARAVEGDDDTRRVLFRYELAGRPHESSLDVRWDDESSEWMLTQSLTLSLFVDAVQSKVSFEPAPFRIPGIADTVSSDAGTAPSLYLVYPGEYTITAAFPEDRLAPGTSKTQSVVADIPGDAQVQFDVVKLPSR